MNNISIYPMVIFMLMYGLYVMLYNGIRFTPYNIFVVLKMLPLMWILGALFILSIPFNIIDYILSRCIFTFHSWSDGIIAKLDDLKSSTEN